jgi:general secretion pathway protein D
MTFKRVLVPRAQRGLPDPRPAGAGPALASPGAQAERTESFTFAFRDADIAQVAEEILGNALGVPYTVDPGVTGKVSFRIDRRLTRAQLLEAFEAALAVNDVAVLRQGDSLVLAPRDKARSSAALRDPSAIGGARRGGYDVVAVPLSFSTPTEVAKALEAMTGSKAVLYSNDKLWPDRAGRLGRGAAVAAGDHQGPGPQRLRGRAHPLVRFAPGGGGRGGGRLAKILATAGVQGVSVSPLNRLNGLIVSARTETAMNEVGGWIAPARYAVARSVHPALCLSSAQRFGRLAGPNPCRRSCRPATTTGGGFNSRQSGSSASQAVDIRQRKRARARSSDSDSDGDSPAIRSWRTACASASTATATP